MINSYFPGTLVKLKGGILTMALLDSTATLLPPSYEPWYDPNASDEEKEKSRRRRPASPPSSQEGPDPQFVVVCSDKQAKVVAMPSQTRIHKHNITESSFLLRADVVLMAGENCIACFCANGHIMTLRYCHWKLKTTITIFVQLISKWRYNSNQWKTDAASNNPLSDLFCLHSLPSLRPLLDVNYLPLTDMRIARTFCFSNLGQALYLTTPTEFQRITYSQETCNNLQVRYSSSGNEFCNETSEFMWQYQIQWC